ncbi:hypothetical protein ABZU75_19235 [Streptosporangium sp. NPDC005286]|uniref:hypothetical protein n=1 Tax=Streptosporangium sp. NPDC005286 TaxID=3154463 RepID=UPI0033A194B5
MTQLAVGCAVVPSTRTRLVACSMTARMYWRWPLRVTVSMKSQARSASACERRKSAHVLDARSGAGSTPSCLRISQTVDGATLIPSVTSSPCTRRYPQAGFSRTRRRMRARMERIVGGRPGRLDRQVRA